MDSLERLYWDAHTYTGCETPMRYLRDDIYKKYTLRSATAELKKWKAVRDIQYDDYMKVANLFEFCLQKTFYEKGDANWLKHVSGIIPRDLDDFKTDHLEFIWEHLFVLKDVNIYHRVWEILPYTPFMVSLARIYDETGCELAKKIYNELQPQFNIGDVAQYLNHREAKASVEEHHTPC